MTLAPILEQSERNSVNGRSSSSGLQPGEVAPRVLEDWETDERGYIFEERLEVGTRHKDVGNEHYKRGEWDLALRRYERALYHCTFDPMQMYDLMDKHKAAAYAVQTPVKLNYVACVLKCREAGLPLPAVVVEGEEEPREPLDRCDDLLQEVLKAEPEHAKAHFRRAQLRRERGDVSAAREELATAEKLAGSTAALRAERAKLNAMAKEERGRERALFAGKIQPASEARAAEAVLARRASRHQLLQLLFTPVTAPVRLLWWAADGSVGAVRVLIARLQRLLVALVRLPLRPRTPPEEQAQRREQGGKSR